MTTEQRTALITGASSGIGSVFARHLAARGYDLILVARRRERLEALAQETHRQHGITADVFVADLAKSEDVRHVADRIEALPRLDLLINNAGFGSIHTFVELDLNMQLDMIHVHVLASVRLTRAALPGMIKRQNGAIINVASMAGFLPMPKVIVYAATKSFLITFSEGLAKELANTGVHVQALCPGFTYTEFHDAPEFEGFSRSQTSASLWMAAEDVVAESLKALEKNQTICVPGWKNRVFLRLIRSPLGKALIKAVAGNRWK